MIPNQCQPGVVASTAPAPAQLDPVIGGAIGLLKITGEDIEAMTSTVPRLQGKHLIDNAGHWVQQERPEEVSRLLIDFLLKTGTLS
ncbi:alpha/beta fold hydrolase [Pseudomonas profundi]|uniref:alpha/beta fold hydrolase n=1 Tax=Pseudomonas profundi TaxID=1981513 RepID=UPI00123A2CEA|nr:alpha/beta hydrolase [Pseudomonas profundi]